MNTRFTLNGRSLAYADSDYNCTRLNERAVEVPVALALLCHARSFSGSILEVGAVLPHYRPGWPSDGHVCVDLFEPYQGVINADVLTWEPPLNKDEGGRMKDEVQKDASPPHTSSLITHPCQFDLILCISTLDHLRDEEEFCTALERLHTWRKRDGLLFVTLPYGQPDWVGGGLWLDRLIDSDALHADATWRMDKSRPLAHEWTEITDDSPPVRTTSRPLMPTRFTCICGGRWQSGGTFTLLRACDA